MSHIVKGKVAVRFESKEYLLKALRGLGVVAENEKLYRVGVGYTQETYPLVLISADDPSRRIGYRQSNGVWEQYQENYGDYGRWTRTVGSLIQDRYIAYHYEQQLKDEGFTVLIHQHVDGSIELEAEEMVW